MLTNRYEYQTISIPYTMLIDGGVLPLREADDKKQLRGEDICYLSEYMNRVFDCSRCQLYSIPKNTQMNHQIVGQRYVNVIQWIKGMAQIGNEQQGAVVYPSATWDSMYYYDVWKSVMKTAPCEFNPSAKMVFNITADENDFQHRSSLNTNSIQYCFNDILNIRRFQTYLIQPITQTTFTTNLRQNDPDDRVPARRAPRFPTIYTFRSEDYFGEDSEHETIIKTGWKEWSPASLGSLTYSIPIQQLNWLDGQAIVFLELGASKSWYTNAERYQHDNTDYKFVFPLTCSKNTNGYVVYGQQIINSVRSVVSTLGMDGDEPPYKGYSSDGSRGVFMVTISIDSIGWSVLSMNNNLYY